jgi:hypothetical protein
MDKPIRLSKAARDLLRRRANSERVDVTPGNLETYRELARAGIMEPFTGFMRGPEAVFRFTQRGWERREELQRCRFAPSAMLVCPSNRALRAEDRPWQAAVGTVAAHGAVICWRPQPGGKGSGERGGVAPCG